MRRWLANVLLLGRKELASLASDRFLLAFIVYAFSLDIYSVATGVQTEVVNASVAVADGDRSVLSARLNSAEAVAGLTYELTVIASVVIGGTSLFGGIGTIFGTVVGTLLIGVLLNGLVLNNVSSYVQQIIIGVIIVLAVAFDTFAKSRRRKA